MVRPLLRAFLRRPYFLAISQAFDGEQAILPILHLADRHWPGADGEPARSFRDTLAFADYAQALAIACVVLAVASVLDVPRMFSS